MSVFFHGLGHTINFLGSRDPSPTVELLHFYIMAYSSMDEGGGLNIISGRPFVHVSC